MLVRQPHQDQSIKMTDAPNGVDRFLSGLTSVVIVMIPAGVRLLGKATLRARIVLILLAVTLGLVACGAVHATTETSSDAQRVCSQEAKAFGPAFSVLGAFETTVGSIRSIGARGPNPTLWSGEPAEDKAVLCYLEGPVAKSSPGGAPFDRAVVGVAAGNAEFIMAGYRSSIPVRAP